MNKALGIAPLAASIVLLVFGISETDSFASHFSRFFTGNPTDKSMWLVLGGVASFLVGAVMMRIVNQQGVVVAKASLT